MIHQRNLMNMQRLLIMMITAGWHGDVGVIVILMLLLVSSLMVMVVAMMVVMSMAKILVLMMTVAVVMVLMAVTERCWVMVMAMEVYVDADGH